MKAGTYHRRALNREARARKGEGEVPAPVPKLPTRGECRQGPRPCPHFTCRYHLMTDVRRNGSLRLLVDADAMDGSRDTCALDLAEAGPQSLGIVGMTMHLTGERIRQLEIEALEHVRKYLLGRGIAEEMMWEYFSSLSSSATKYSALSIDDAQPRGHTEELTREIAINKTLTALGLEGEDITWIKDNLNDLTRS